MVLVAVCLLQKSQGLVLLTNALLQIIRVHKQWDRIRPFVILFDCPPKHKSQAPENWGKKGTGGPESFLTKSLLYPFQCLHPVEASKRFCICSCQHLLKCTNALAAHTLLILALIIVLNVC